MTSATLSFDKYNSLVFDCDGVVLNSNKIKTRAFYNTTISYGEESAKLLVKYHVENGGVSRYKKFDYFINNILPPDAPVPELYKLVTSYANEVRHGLLDCEVAEGLAQLRARVSNANWFIVSGGDQAELREVFTKRKLSKFFDGGIYGSPQAKDEILSREIDNGNIRQPAVFLGDSRYDHEAAQRAGLDFVFISQWTEFKDWTNYCDSRNLWRAESLISEIHKNA